MTGRHEAPWVPDTSPGYQGHRRQLTEEREATDGIRLCVVCVNWHFRAYPENPDWRCRTAGCQCWCMT